MSEGVDVARVADVAEGFKPSLAAEGGGGSSIVRELAGSQFSFWIKAQEAALADLENERKKKKENEKEGQVQGAGIFSRRWSLIKREKSIYQIHLPKSEYSEAGATSPDSEWISALSPRHRTQGVLIYLFIIF